MPQNIKFNPKANYFEVDKGRETLPAMVGLISDVNSSPLGCHVTFLNPGKYGKARVKNPKKSFRFGETTLTGGTIKLGTYEPGEPLVLTEGIETGLAVKEATRLCVWACVSANGLEKASIPLDCDAIYILGDLDRNGTGQGAAVRLAERLYREENQKIYIVSPDGPIPDDKNSLDWLDVFNKEGTRKLRQAFKKAPLWNHKISCQANPLMESNHLPEFPIGVFPKWIEDFVEAVANATETPRDLVAILVLAVLGACCQRTFVISLRPGYIEPLSIWAIVALESGNRKTAVFQEVIKPVLFWEKEISENLRPEIQRSRLKRELIEARIQALKKPGKISLQKNNKKSRFRMIFDLESRLPKVPTIPRLFTQDITPEKLGALMDENGKKMAILSDEGGIFNILAGRYHNGIPNLDLFLQSYSGTTVRVDRNSRDPVLMENSALTIGLSPQPRVLREVVGNPIFIDRGLVSRFLYSQPVSKMGYRTNNCKSVKKEVRKAYHDGIYNLLRQTLKMNEDQNFPPINLRPSTEAKNTWGLFWKKIERQMRPDGNFRHRKDWAGKLPGSVGRISGILHCAEHSMDGNYGNRVCLQTMQNACTIGWYFSRHALAVFLNTKDLNLTKKAQKCLEWIKKIKLEKISARDCFQALKSTFKTMENLELAFQELIKSGYLSEIKIKKGSSPGRPSRKLRVLF